MSLSRAFTTRRSRKPSDVDVSAVPQRSLTTKYPFSPGTVRHQKISAPIELISTTNMLSYNAPDIFPRGRSSTNSSTNSDGRSINSNSDSTSPSSIGTPYTSPDISSVESSPTTTSSEPNHLSCYFGHPVTSDDDAPLIPTRALSHTKRSAEYLARKRSISRMSSPKGSISTSSNPAVPTARSTYNNMFNPNAEMAEHPFGNELAQVSELAEEYCSSKEKLPLTIVDEEEQELASKGLFKFRAEDYMSELQGLFTSVFGDQPKMSSPTVWI